MGDPQSRVGNRGGASARGSYPGSPGTGREGKAWGAARLAPAPPAAHARGRLPSPRPRLASTPRRPTPRPPPRPSPRRKRQYILTPLELLLCCGGCFSGSGGCGSRRGSPGCSTGCWCGLSSPAAPSTSGLSASAIPLPLPPPPPPPPALRGSERYNGGGRESGNGSRFEKAPSAQLPGSRENRSELGDWERVWAWCGGWEWRARGEGWGGGGGGSGPPLPKSALVEPVEGLTCPEAPGGPCSYHQSSCRLAPNGVLGYKSRLWVLEIPRALKPRLVNSSLVGAVQIIEAHTTLHL